MAGHPLSKGNCYFEVRLVDSDAVSQPLTLLLKVSSASFPRVFFFFYCAGFVDLTDTNCCATRFVHQLSGYGNH